MTEQLAMDFAKPRSRSRDPATSHAAARLVCRFEHGDYALILAALTNGPATIHEIATATGRDVHAVARRLPELESVERVAPTGEERPSPSGRQCRVWRKVEA